MRRNVIWSAGWILWLALVVFVTARCGKDKEDKKSGGDDAGEDAGFVPDDWDGKTDWSGSTLEVIEE